MYRCLRCGNTFYDEEVDVICEDHGYDTEYVHIPYYEYENHCPYCGDDWLEEIYEIEEPDEEMED